MPSPIDVASAAESLPVLDPLEQGLTLATAIRAPLSQDVADPAKFFDQPKTSKPLVYFW